MPPWSSPLTPSFNESKLDARQSDALLAIYAILRDRIDDPLNELDPFKYNLIYSFYMELEKYYKQQYD